MHATNYNWLSKGKKLLNVIPNMKPLQSFPAILTSSRKSHCMQCQREEQRSYEQGGGGGEGFLSNSAKHEKQKIKMATGMRCPEAVRHERDISNAGR